MGLIGWLALYFVIGPPLYMIAAGIAAFDKLTRREDEV